MSRRRNRKRRKRIKFQNKNIASVVSFWFQDGFHIKEQKFCCNNSELKNKYCKNAIKREAGAFMSLIQTLKKVFVPYSFEYPLIAGAGLLGVAKGDP